MSFTSPLMNSAARVGVGAALFVDDMRTEDADEEIEESLSFPADQVCRSGDGRAGVLGTGDRETREFTEGCVPFVRGGSNPWVLGAGFSDVETDVDVVELS
jgi:hypothetical protein